MEFICVSFFKPYKVKTWHAYKMLYLQQGSFYSTPLNSLVVAQAATAQASRVSGPEEERKERNSNLFTCGRRPAGQVMVAV